MNTTLREFLNLNDDGTPEYRYKDIYHDTKWNEAGSIGSQYHQTDATGEYLNAKFVNGDGRELVFDKDGKVVSTYPDKGTFNYVDGWLLNSINFGPVVIGGHAKYDMKTYDTLMASLNLNTKKKFYIDILSPFKENSKYWDDIEKGKGRLIFGK
jgi:hypothetical protein